MILARIFLEAAAASTLFAQAALAAPASPKLKPADLDRELTQLRALKSNGAVVRQRPPGCTEPENRQFDFWLGEWDVSMTGTTDLVAESSITLADQGCVILETWRPFQGASGHSINGFDSSAKEWKQTWIDATGRITPYGGTMQDGTLIMDDRSGQTLANQKFAKRRMNFHPIDDSTVRQWGEGWDNAKQAWVVTWDLTYRRRPSTRADRP
ncbi:hypothetical protein [Aquisediminimonas profunda]|uniref:hypothetical protein n=1 Tax=Aquisediminimonas profunda TaxID=1550733 RepID=UPI001C62FE8C|nr:hypothetical protein [Aquisediminimonas profunda]